MTKVSSVMAVAEMQARDVLRRRAVMALFVLLPAAFYYSVPAGEDYSLLAGLMGVTWAVGAAGVFGMLGWRRVDPRLALAGASPVQGLLGRLLLLLALATGLVALFVPQILVRSADLLVDPSAAVLSLTVMATVSVPLGLAVGALAPRELEGMLLLIGVIGVGMSVPPDAGLALVLPLWGPTEVMLVAAGLSDGHVGTALLHAGVCSLLLLALAALGWRRRVHIHRQE